MVAPVQIGGPLTYAVVHGNSMEPKFHNNDFVVARKSDSYRVGDIVIYDEMGGKVIHQIVPCEFKGIHCTQGLNNKYPDSWGVRDSQILGKYLFKSALVGNLLTKAAKSPETLGLGLSALFALTFLPLPHHRKTNELKSLLAISTKAPRLRTPRYNLVFIASFALMLLSMAITILSIKVSTLLSSATYAAFAGFAVSIALVSWSASYVFNGHGLYEPYKTFAILSGKLHHISEDVEVPAVDVEIESAPKLRNLSDRYRLPIIYKINPRDQSHDFYLITSKKTYRFTLVDGELKRDKSGEGVEVDGSEPRVKIWDLS